ncbi:MAG: hypothetical protein H6595_09145 [Flavobacteriales bacterium]|nr:hypothetical protein [Flavobacteriales bacterium]MCB9167633.1 hypothetical protein [Flavobacteriales bacterium]
MIATLFGKKRISEDKLANVFVNALLELVDRGFVNVVGELKEAPEFEVAPDIEQENEAPFLLIVLAGNLMEAKRQLPPGTDVRLASLVVSKFSHATGSRAMDIEQRIGRLQGSMSRLNAPSKNTVYAMSKAVFHQYDLFPFQKAYFREQRVPDPIILKRMNALMAYFLWDWEEFHENYRIG